MLAPPCAAVVNAAAEGCRLAAAARWYEWMPATDQCGETEAEQTKAERCWFSDVSLCRVQRWEACRDIAELLPGATMAADDRLALGCHEVPKSTHVLMRKALNPKEANSTMQVYLQLGQTTSRTRALQLLCEQVSSAHHRLRKNSVLLTLVAFMKTPRHL